MPTELVVTSPAAPGIGALRAHYATVDAALRVANRLLDEGTSMVWIVDDKGNTILQEDQVKLRNKLISQNIKARDQLRSQLHKFETGVYYLGANKAGGPDNDVTLQWIDQLRLWIAERDTLLLDLDSLVGRFLVRPSGNGHAD